MIFIFLMKNGPKNLLRGLKFYMIIQMDSRAPLPEKNISPLKHFK